MTIDKLVLRNFQGHKHSTLEFHPNVSAIVGESDEGKTSIIRALYWAAQNKPSGGDFISDFSKRGECSASIEVDGQTVTRFKNKSKNQYKHSAFKEPFNAIGKGGIPQEVKETLQLSELNFQNQMDSPFLLSNNGGEVARYLNKVANLDIISSSLTKIKAKVTDCNTEIKRTEGSIKTKKAELAEMDWIDKADMELASLSTLHFVYEKENADQALLTETLNDTDDLLEELDKFKERDDELYQISLLIDEYKAFKTYSDYLDEFTSDLNGVKAISDKIDSLPLDLKEIESLGVLQVLIDSFLPEEERLNELLVLLDNTYDIQEGIAELNTDNEIKAFNELDSLVSTYQIEKDLLNEFDYLLSDIDEWKVKKEVCVESVQTLEAEFKESFPNKCDSDSCPLMEA